jgi:hypothetical protein
MSLRSVIEQQVTRHGWAVPAGLCFAGAVMRLGWLAARGSPGVGEGEAANAAVALVERGYFGDPYGFISGPTAHLTPSMSLIAAAVYRIFGVRTDMSEILLALISIAIVLAAGLIFYAAARAAEWPRLWAWLPLGVFSIVPLNVQLEAVYFRVWEGGLAVLIAGLALMTIIRAAREPDPGLRSILLPCVLCAICFFVSPPMGLGTYACLGWLVLTRFRFVRWPGVALAGLIALALVFAPWVARNSSAFDRFIPLRSNFGLEIAIANYPGAMQGDPKAFVERIHSIHPYGMPRAQAEAALSNGEFAYAKTLEVETKQWIAQNPGNFVRLCLTHLREFYFPPAWQWTIYSAKSAGTYAKMAIVWSITALGLIGAALALFVWRGPSIYFALLALVPGLPYMIVQPILRYRYLVLLPLLFLASAVLCRLIGWLGRRFNFNFSWFGQQAGQTQQASDLTC